MQINWALGKQREKMEFLIDESESLNILDSKISELLTDVYVGDKYIEPEEAVKLFEVTALNNRGVIICAVEKQSLTLAGSVIVVQHNSPDCKIAQENESEMHLLCVNSKYRNNGLGKLLINAAIDMATQNGNNKMILWTQQSMKAAQRLYTNSEFIHIKNISRNNREFLVYEKILNA